MKTNLLSIALLVVLGLSSQAATIVEVTGVTGHDGGNWTTTLGHLSDAVNGNGSNNLGTGDHNPGMDTSADPNDPSTWLKSNTSWQTEWNANSRLDPGSSLNSKIGWMVIDFGSTINDLDTAYLWSQRDGNRASENMSDFNLYYSNGAGIDSLPAMPNSTSKTGDYDFSSGDWTLIGSYTQTLSSGSHGYVNAIDLTGIDAQYIGIEIITGQGADTRIGFGQIEVTAADPIPEPSVALLSGLGALMLLRRRKH